MGVLLDALAPFLEAALAWLVRMLGRLFSSYAVPALLQMSGISFAGQFLMIAAFMLVVNQAVSLLMQHFTAYITTLFSNQVANSLWLCFVSLLPVNLATDFQIIVSSVSFLIGIRLLILFGKLFVQASANKTSVKSS
ncbi:hypothetical protein DJ252_24100 [Salmonella enterica subsp. enterica serovar Uzaramo]|nr:hypothetical protein [Salmonella enterica]EEE9948003.1 hypothetical protein [Salmonella enterica subsp. enterica serovar Uzaramo]EEL6611816.1 hypothetical protein [Salmonella enterica]EFO5310532.1 hypothetical protein [Salmonella enterica]EFO8059036.1 hypothetical protein [Salmonella enterica]